MTNINYMAKNDEIYNINLPSRSNNISYRRARKKLSLRTKTDASDINQDNRNILLDSDMNVARTKVNRSKPTAGKAAHALKAFRERVYEVPGFPKLTHKQMAVEANFVNRLGKVSASSYQYNEDVYPRDFFTLDQVRKFMTPLTRRGIPEAEIFRVLVGFVPVSSTPTFHVDWPSGTDVRGVPVLSRKTVYRLAKGEITLGKVGSLEPAAITELEAAGLIMGWLKLPDASDDTVIMELEDGSGSRLVVDRADRDLVDGESYVFLLGDGMIYAEYRDQVLYSEEGATYGDEVQLNNRMPVPFGKVTWLMEKKARTKKGRS